MVAVWIPPHRDQQVAIVVHPCRRDLLDVDGAWILEDQDVDHDGNSGVSMRARKSNSCIAMGLLLDAQGMRVDVDEGVSFADVATARHDPDPACVDRADDVDVLKAGLGRH